VLLLPALLERSARTLFAVGGTLTVVAGIVAWGMARTRWGAGAEKLEKTELAGR
jgi:hypothetical protein